VGHYSRGDVLAPVAPGPAVAPPPGPPAEGNGEA
jgi:hypothetical protein